MNFFRTVSFFWKNALISPWLSLFRHTCWQGHKVLSRFPCDIHLEDITIRVTKRAVANGAGALINAMEYYDPNSMHFLKEIFRLGLCRTFWDIGVNIGIYSLIVASGSSYSRIAQPVSSSGDDLSSVCIVDALLVKPVVPFRSDSDQQRC